MAETSQSTPTFQLSKSLSDAVERSYNDSADSEEVLSLISRLAQRIHELSPDERRKVAALMNEQFTTPPEHEITIDAFLQEWDDTPWEEKLSLCQTWWQWTIGPDWSLYQRLFENLLERQDHGSLIQVLEYYLKTKVPYRKRPHFWEGLAKHRRFSDDVNMVKLFTV